MKKIGMRHILMIVSLLAILVLPVVLNARPTLARDPNGTAIQFCRTFSTSADTTVTGTATAPDSTAVVANSVLVTILAKDQIIYLRNVSTTTPAATTWVQIPAGLPITLPVQSNTYIVYRALTGTAKVYFFWQKM